MALWALLLELTRFALFATAHLFGGSIGAGIFAFSLVLRIALLPVTLRAARQAHEQRLKLAALKPELDRIKKRFAGDRAAEAKATIALHEKHQVRMAPTGGLASVIQLGIGMSVYRSLATGVRRNTAFLWIRDLTRPDVGLALVAAGIAGLAARAAGGENPRIAMAIATTLTFFFAWRMSASVALYSIAWSGVSAGEAYFVRRRATT